MHALAGLLDKPDVEIKTGGPDLSSDSWTATPPKTETGGAVVRTGGAGAVGRGWKIRQGLGFRV
eukprot:354973-Chlamydomonas_euryale.AAC.3